MVQQCIAQCEAAADCPGGTGDCDGNCVNDLEQARHIQCVIEYELLLDCIDTAGDACDTTECATRVSEYTSCFGEFCGANPSDDRCSQGGSG